MTESSFQEQTVMMQSSQSIRMQQRFGMMERIKIVIMDLISIKMVMEKMLLRMVV